MLCDNFGLLLSLNLWATIYCMKIKSCMNVWMCTRQNMVEDTKINVAVEAGQNCPKVQRFGVSNVIFTLFMEHIGDMISCQLILMCYVRLTILSTNNKHKS